MTPSQQFLHRILRANHRHPRPISRRTHVIPVIIPVIILLQRLIHGHSPRRPPCPLPLIRQRPLQRPLSHELIQRRPDVVVDLWIIAQIQQSQRVVVLLQHGVKILRGDVGHVIPLEVQLGEGSIVDEGEGEEGSDVVGDVGTSHGEAVDGGVRRQRLEEQFGRLEGREGRRLESVHDQLSEGRAIAFHLGMKEGEFAEGEEFDAMHVHGIVDVPFVISLSVETGNAREAAADAAVVGCRVVVVAGGIELYSDEGAHCQLGSSYTPQRVVVVVAIAIAIIIIIIILQSGTTTNIIQHIHMLRILVIQKRIPPTGGRRRFFPDHAQSLRAVPQRRYRRRRSDRDNILSTCLSGGGGGLRVSILIGQDDARGGVPFQTHAGSCGVPHS
mmetsp:Transcript_34086/g.73761  ORF Transcript_34086/g.73761 Transcript_34086/m.73761 type:complete len:386 (-) Transcript_34086:1467-2624(-)